MNWRHKAFIQNLISGLPASERIYYAVQRTFGELRSDRFDPTEWLQVAARVLQRLRSAGISITGKRFLEVGTGRAVGVPTGLWLCGAGKILTVDLHRYLSPALVAASNRYICLDPEKIKEMFAGYSDSKLFEDRLSQLMAFKGDLPAFLDLINTEWLAPADARHLSFPDNCFDFHFSYAVFEHVPGPIIRDILKEAKRLLHSQGVLLHAIDLSDHFSYSDNSITKINFLQFSDERWQRLAGNQYMYHNRLRAFEFYRLFEEEGVFLARKTENVDTPSLEALKRGFPLDSRFKSMPPEELAVTNINLVGSFSPTTAKQLRGSDDAIRDSQRADPKTSSTDGNPT
jgi:SAM-dependent methyltransferase